MTQISFESLGCPSFYVGAGNLLALYASGRTTGITIDCGYDTIKLAGIYEGFILPNSVETEDLGGKDLTEYLHKLLNILLYDWPNWTNIDID